MLKTRFQLRLALLCVLTLGSAAFTRAQTTAAPSPKRQFSQFDVASVKENRSDAGDVSMNFPLGAGDAYTSNDGLLRVRNMPFAGYIVFAYKLSPAQGEALSKQLPAWAKSTKYDIEARVNGNPGKDEMRRMMQALLADRFQLRLHAISQQISVLDMMLTRPGKLGSALKPHPSDDPKCLITHAPEGFFSPCGIFGAMPGIPVKAAGRNIPLQMFADNISSYAGKTVVDKTGLSGTFDFTLEFAPDLDSPASPDPAGPSFLQALSEQIGFKLVPGKASQTFYSLDQIERPSPN